MGIHIKGQFPPMMHEARRSCRLCEASKHTEVEIKFDAGSHEPIATEVLTAASGDTGIVATVDLVSGAWASGTAAGYVTMTSPTGIDDDGHWGVDNEAVTGSHAAALTLDGEGTQKIYGLLYPESYLVERDSAYYCRPHYQMRFGPKDRDSVILDLSD